MSLAFDFEFILSEYIDFYHLDDFGRWVLSFVLFYLLRQSTIEVTGLREGGDVWGCPWTALMVLV